MYRPDVPPEFEDQLQRAMAVPEPDSEALDGLRVRFIAQGAASLRAKRPDNPFARLFPSGQKAKPIFAQHPAWQWSLLALVILIGLGLATPGAVKALRPLLGYIPSVGIVEQSPSTLVLDKPVRVERDGVTLTVEQAVGTAEKTVVVYSFTEPVPGGGSQQPEPTASYDRPILQLPNGSSLDVKTGHRQPSDPGKILYALDFGPLPPGTNRVTLELPRLTGMPPGMGPENWQIPLRFKPGQPSQLALPVVEYTPAPTLAPTAQQEQPAQTAEIQVPPISPLSTHGAAIALEKAVELPDGYILMGSLKWSDPSIPQYAMTLGEPVVKDANDQVIAFEPVLPETYPQQDELRQYWAFKISTKKFAAPLRLAFSIQAQEAANATFQFDPGPNPHDGQTWDLNIDVPVDNHPVKVVSAKYLNPVADNRVFEFTLTSGPGVTGAQVFDQNHPSMGGGGGGKPQDNVPFTSAFGVEGELPDGPMTIVIHSLDMLLPGNWTITWAP